MRTLITLAILLTTSTLSYSQIFEPVKWTFGSKSIDEGQAVVFMKATMDKGWYIYSLDVPDGGPMKTSFSFHTSEAYALVGKTLEPNPKSTYESVFDMDVPYFDNEVVFQQRIKLNTTGATRVSGVIEFMSCDAERCLPQEEMPFALIVR